MTKKNKELKYEKINRVARWNYCQFIAKNILDSSISNQELERILRELESPNRRLILEIK